MRSDSECICSQGICEIITSGILLTVMTKRNHAMLLSRHPQRVASRAPQLIAVILFSRAFHVVLMTPGVVEVTHSCHLDGCQTIGKQPTYSALSFPSINTELSIAKVKTIAHYGNTFSSVKNFIF